MDFRLSDAAADLRCRLLDFMEEHVYPAEAAYQKEMEASGNPHHHAERLETLKDEARHRGLWNLFLPRATPWSDGLSNLDYAPLAEIMGRSPLGPEACNCSAPDTGNMEILAKFGTPDQQERWLRPLLEGTIRSGFAMTEPAVASSDATNIECSITPDGAAYIVNGRKWWTTGAASPRCRVLLVMGKTDPSGPKHQQQSIVLVPIDSPGVRVVRSLPVFGYQHAEGHCEIVLENVRIPKANLLGAEGAGFTVAQARLGPGRIHHCMRTLGAAERALELLCVRAHERAPFGRLLAEQGVVQQWVADARIRIDQARLYTYYAAWLMDTAGTKAAKKVLSGIKVAVPQAALDVLDKAIQVHGAMGLCDDTPLPWMYASIRGVRIADGPDEVHRMVIARHELNR